MPPVDEHVAKLLCTICIMFFVSLFSSSVFARTPVRADDPCSITKRDPAVSDKECRKRHKKRVERALRNKIKAYLDKKATPVVTSGSGPGI